MSFVYILKSVKDNELYVGKSRDVNKRLQEHNSGFVPSTKERRPLEIIAYFKLPNEQRADSFEKYLKTGSGKAFLRKRVI